MQNITQKEQRIASYTGDILRNRFYGTNEAGNRTFNQHCLVSCSKY